MVPFKILFVQVLIKGFILKVEKQFEEPLVSILEPKFKKNSNGEEENASLYDEYNEDIEVLNW